LFGIIPVVDSSYYYYYYYYYYYCSHNSVVSTGTGMRAGRSGFQISAQAKYFSKKRPDWLWSPPSRLFSRYRASFPGG